MSNEQKNSRTVIEDLPVVEQELTAAEMGNVQGGKAAEEKKKETQQIAGNTLGTTAPTAASTSKTTSTTQGTSFGT